MNKHDCSGIVKCLHCSESHYSNDLKCKMIKNYRADLRSLLLSSTNNLANNMFNSTTEFSPLPRPTNSTIAGYKSPLGQQNIIISKLDQIHNSINDAMSDLMKRAEQIEEWIFVEEKFILGIKDRVTSLLNGNVRYEAELLKQSKILKKCIIPAIEDILSMFIELNAKYGRIVNADFQSRSNVSKNQLQTFREQGFNR